MKGIKRNISLSALAHHQMLSTQAQYKCERYLMSCNTSIIDSLIKRFFYDVSRYDEFVASIQNQWKKRLQSMGDLSLRRLVDRDFVCAIAIHIQDREKVLNIRIQRNYLASQQIVFNQTDSTSSRQIDGELRRKRRKYDLQHFGELNASRGIYFRFDVGDVSPVCANFSRQPLEQVEHFVVPPLFCVLFNCCNLTLDTYAGGNNRSDCANRLYPRWQAGIFVWPQCVANKGNDEHA